MALGGGFQAYFSQRRDGSVKPDEMEVMADVARFARERQPYCHHSTQIPQVALLFSTEAYQRESPGLFSRYTGNSRLRGVLQCLLEGQNSVDIVTEDMLGHNMKRFPLIVVPEWNYLSAVFRDDLMDYVKEGGNLVVIGKETSALFEGKLPGNVSAAAAGSVSRFEKGKICFIPHSVGMEYLESGDEALHRLVNGTVRSMFTNPVVEVKGTQWVDVSASRLGGKLAVHLVNTSGKHSKLTYIEEVKPVRDLQITIRSDKKPSKVTLQPLGKECRFTYAGGQIKVNVDAVPIYEILVVE